MRRSRWSATVFASIALVGALVATLLYWGAVVPHGIGPPTSVAPSCDGAKRSTHRASDAPVTWSDQWAVSSPRDDSTFDLSQVTSTAYPSDRSVLALGTSEPAARTCLVGGAVLGGGSDDQTWEVYHQRYNAACVKIIAREWMRVTGLRCDNVEDGIRPAESRVNGNNTNLYVTDTYLTRIRDDCLENDFVIGGLLQDSLWEQCNTGVSERPWDGTGGGTPRSEYLVLDHMLIGLYETPHVVDGRTVMGENALFKWSDTGNRLVIRCSIFKVDSVSLNGEDAMALPPGTVVDDSDCPDDPSTLVWLGRGRYPAETGNLRVVHDASVWDQAVELWKQAHGMPPAP
jgi:hypothetical protein